MAARAYYDETLAAAAAQQVLAKMKAKKGRKHPSGGYVYSVSSDGEALVEQAGSGRLRVRLYAGKCPC